ncbi:sensor histidine kinase [Hungatella effluvii]|uniref:sensor histidine kinase n=1 Tax=Hungatella effluvii TaxID=1096246 RepID=UPI0022E70851|nr:sensor histidine kinase [Hungatella effluvii]
MKKSPPKFRSQLITMTMVTCICSVLVLGITLILIFISSFSKNAGNDMKFYLESTTEQFDLRMQYLEDIITDLRHSVEIREFFDDGSLDSLETSRLLSYNCDLFSSRNMVDSSYPFVERLYLFNNYGKYASCYYYPITLAARDSNDRIYQDMESSFRKSGEEFSYATEDGQLILCMWIYDETMNPAGTCLVSLGTDSINRIFSTSRQYDDSFWSVLGLHGVPLIGNTDKMPSEVMSGISTEKREGTVSTARHLISSRGSGFGISCCIGVPNSTVYDSIRSTIGLFTVVFFLVLGIVAITVFFISYSFTRPLKTVADKIKQFGGGSFDTRLDSFGTQEFNDISVVFNEMTEQINYLITQVYEKQLLAARSQMRFLQAQINPHFMFNILAMISMKAGLCGNTEIQKLLSAFSKLLQGKIFRSGEILIPLSEELELVEFYLYLQSNRFSGKINYEIQCSDGLEQVKIPRLCIEPLVENAVSHGLEPKAGNGKILVSIWRKDDFLWIRVEDDGDGFDVEEWKNQRGQSTTESEGLHTHVGLSNTEKLLHIFYEDKAVMNVESQTGKGTRVTIILPPDSGEGKTLCGM